MAVIPTPNSGIIDIFSLINRGAQLSDAEIIYEHHFSVIILTGKVSDSKMGSAANQANQYSHIAHKSSNKFTSHVHIE